MNRGAVAAIALAVMAVAIVIGMTDPSRDGQQIALAVGFFASVVILIGILSGVNDGGSSTQGDTSQTVNFYMPPQPAAPPPQPAAQPQIVYIPVPQQAQPAYLPHPGYAPQPHALPQYEPAPALAHYPQQQAQYRGALDVVAEPVYSLPYHPQQQVRRAPVAQLESPKGSWVRRLAQKAKVV